MSQEESSPSAQNQSGSTDHLLEDHPHPAGHQRVVCIALDFDEHSHHAYTWALENFLRKETDLVVLLNSRGFVLPPTPYGIGNVDFTDYVTKVGLLERENSHGLLKDYAARLKSNDYAVRAVALQGDAREELVRKTDELNADVLILGSRNLGIVKRTFLGSVSDYCTHNCECAVIIVKNK